MRSEDEIVYMLKHPAEFIKSDLYKVGLVELYPFVPIEYIHEIHRKHIPQNVLDGWNPEEDRHNFDCIAEAKNEYVYLEKLIKVEELVPVTYRIPRLFAIIWLGGYDINDFDEKLNSIRNEKDKYKCKAKLKSLLHNISKTYSLNK